jgi:HAD superfamily hydrolase (TIGR01490 family)
MIYQGRWDSLKLAIFDFDGTLFPMDTLPFLLGEWRREGRSLRRLLAVYASVGTLFIGYKLGIACERSREMLHRMALQRVTRLFAGMSEAELSAFFQRNAALMVPLLRPSVMSELRCAQEQGYHTVLLSGSYETLIKFVGVSIGVDTVIGTALCYKNGIVDTECELDVVCGEDKAARLHAAFAGQPVDWAESIAYADSYSDLPVLRRVGYPVAVCPDRDLAALLPQPGWRVIER